MWAFGASVEGYRTVSGGKKFTCLDLFCGAGGLSLGFEQAGFTILGGVEWDKAAFKTHKFNFPFGKEYCGDIKDIRDDQILENFKDVDVIVGGPPCQGFSSANRHDKEEDDPRNQLFFEYLRFIRLLNPKAFLIENVKEILTKNKGYAKNRILELTEEMGYTVSVKVLQASDYGVPQRRRRAVFVGIRKDLNKVFDFDKLETVKQEVTVYDALRDIINPEDRTSNAFLDYAKDSKFLENHNPKFPCEKVQRRMSFVPQGGNWKNVPPELWDTQRDNRHSSAYRRLKMDEPSITIDTGHMNYFHPLEHRTPTVRESARLQSFPDSFIFVGTQSDQLRQVGNAVPPLMAKALATEIKSLIVTE